MATVTASEAGRGRGSRGRLIKCRLTVSAQLLLVVEATQPKRPPVCFAELSPLLRSYLIAVSGETIDHQDEKRRH